MTDGFGALASICTAYFRLYIPAAAHETRGTNRQQTDNRQTTDAPKTHNSRAHGITVYRSADFEPFWSIAPKLRPSHDCFWCAAAAAAAVEIDLFMIFLRSSGIMNARRPRYTTITSFRTMRPNTVRCTQTHRTLDLAAMIAPNLVHSAHLTPLFLVNGVGTTTSQLQMLQCYHKENNNNLVIVLEL